MNMQRMRGVGLIEVLVAVVVLSVGLLGLAQLQVTALRASHSAAQRLEAVNLATDLLERLRAGGLADRPAPAVLEAELAQWQALLARRLPGGVGTLSLDGALATISVQWSDGRESTAAGAPPVVRLRTRL